MSFAFYSPVTLLHAKVTATQTNFPVLLSFTDARFKSVANGGNVQSASGFDIYAYSDSALTQRIALERESYSATSGVYIGWVNVATLSSTTDTTIYLAYGNAAIVTDPNADSTYGAIKVWDSNFIAVYHLNETGVNPTIHDSTVNAANTSAQKWTPTTGMIDGGASLDGQTSYGETPSDPLLNDFTVSTWLYQTTASANSNLRIVDKNYALGFWFGQGIGNVYGGGILQTSNPYGRFVTLAVGAWHHLVMSRAGTTQNIIGDGGAVTNSGSVVNTQTGSSSVVLFAQNPTQNNFSGLVDEIRISSIARSSTWISTEYNNQNSPSTFETLGSQVPVSGGFAFILSATSAAQTSVAVRRSIFGVLISASELVSALGVKRSVSTALTAVSGMTVSLGLRRILSAALSAFSAITAALTAGQELALFSAEFTISTALSARLALRHSFATILTIGSGVFASLSTAAPAIVRFAAILSAYTGPTSDLGVKYLQGFLLNITSALRFNFWINGRGTIDFAYSLSSTSIIYANLIVGDMVPDLGNIITAPPERRTIHMPARGWLFNFWR